jgi:hypothetical protein
MISIKNKNKKINTLKTAYSKPLIIELSTNAGTQGMGMTPIFGIAKMNIGPEDTFMLRSVS